MIAGLAGRTEQGERLVESLVEPGPSAPKGGVSPASSKEPGLVFPPGSGCLFFQVSNFKCSQHPYIKSPIFLTISYFLEPRSASLAFKHLILLNFWVPGSLNP